MVLLDLRNASAASVPWASITFGVPLALSPGPRPVPGCLLKSDSRCEDFNSRRPCIVGSPEGPQGLEFLADMTSCPASPCPTRNNDIDFLPTNSVTISAVRSLRPSAHQSLIATVRPSIQTMLQHRRCEGCVLRKDDVGPQCEEFLSGLLP